MPVFRLLASAVPQRQTWIAGAALRQAGAAAILAPPKDYDLTAILAEIVKIVKRAKREAA